MLSSFALHTHSCVIPDPPIIMAADPRFARLTTDPRFRRPKQKQLKVELDDRFKHVLQGEDFGATSKGEKGKKKTGKATKVLYLRLLDNY